MAVWKDSLSLFDLALCNDNDLFQTKCMILFWFRFIDRGDEISFDTFFETNGSGYLCNKTIDFFGVFYVFRFCNNDEQ